MKWLPFLWAATSCTKGNLYKNDIMLRTLKETKTLQWIQFQDCCVKNVVFDFLCLYVKMYLTGNMFNEITKLVLKTLQ